jgi:hypothetical protein
MMTLLSSRSWLAILDPALVSGNHLVWVIPATRVQADLSMAMSFTVGGWRGEAQRNAPAWRSHQSRKVAGLFR